MSCAYARNTISNWLCNSLCGVGCRNPSMSLWNCLENLKRKRFEALTNFTYANWKIKQLQKFSKKLLIRPWTPPFRCKKNQVNERKNFVNLRSQKLRSQRTRWGKQYFGLKPGVQLTRFTKAVKMHCWTSKQIQVTKENGNQSELHPIELYITFVGPVPHYKFFKSKKSHMKNKNKILIHT